MENTAAASLLKANTATTEETRIHVLYVDDEVGLLKAAKRILELQGSFHVETVLSVEEAMEKMEARRFDVIVSDYIMPGKDGLEFLRELRESGNSIPFIVFTGKGREIVAIKALNLGADQYVNKIGNPETVYSELAHGIRTAVKGKKAEEALRDIEKEKSVVLDSMSELVVHQDLNHRILWANRKAAGSVNMKPEELKGRYCHEMWAKRADPCTGCPLEACIKTGQPQQGEMTTPDGRVWSINGSLIKDENGNVTSVVEVVTNITEHKRVAAELRREKELMEMVTANTAAGLVIISKDFHILWANRLLTEHLGDMRGKLCYSSLSNLTDVCPGCGVKEILENGKDKVVHEQVVHGSKGQKIWLEITAIPIRDKNGNLVAVSELSIDVTQKKKAEKALKESEKRFRELNDLLPEIVFETDSTGLLTLVNQAAFERFGYSQEDFDKGLKAFQMLAPEDRKRAKENIAKVLRGEKTGPDEYMGLRKDGTKFPFIINSAPIMKENKPVGMRGLIVNITERKKAEEALRESEEKYRTVFENTGTATCIVEDDKTISMVNRRFEELSCYSWKELVGKKWTEFVTKDCLERMIRYHEVRRKQGGKAPTNYSFNFVDRNGQIKNCLLTVNMIAGTKKSVASILDLTELKQTEKALRETEERYRETILNANVGIICHGPEGEVNVLNPKMEQLTGFTISEIPTLHDWFEKVYPNEEERRKIRDTWFKRMSEEGEVKEGHATITTKDGQRRNFLFNGVRLESGDSIAFAIDITESNSAWESLDETLNALMTINEKLNVVGRLTRHDVRNKLSVIANNVYLAKQKLAANHSALEYLSDIESAIDQMEKIFEFSRNYEMLGVEELSYIDVKKNVDEAAILLSGLSAVKLVNECKGLTVMADSLLRQLVYNLIDNTFKYGEKVSRIRVYYEEEAEQLKLVYEDDGVGIAEKEKEKIFRDEYGRGTGYGLYLIRKICENYGWTIQETGVPGKGAQFTMTIPKVNNNGESLYRLS